MRKLVKTVCNIIFTRKYSKKNSQDEYLLAVRNIGILAHIDAGKTTTTERMLFYSGKINSMGEVHKGNTVTDFLDEERERGITISSAAVSFAWRNHQFNLIDTPGHIDFTVEVERTLNVLDGAVVILDASAGVEAQTMTVWRQADRYDLPRLVYLNKMDRIDASVDLCYKSLQTKLGIQPLVLQIPAYGSDEKLVGVVDLVTMKKIVWEKGDGSKFKILDLDRESGKLWEEATELRKILVEKLADNEDSVAYQIIASESHDVPSNVLCNAIRKVTYSQKAFPVICGSSYKNVGVQALMDAIILYLPSPAEKNKQIDFCFGDDLCARAFKVVHDRQKKPVTYFRVYSGSLSKGQKIYNIQQGKNEVISKLMVPYADETLETSVVSKGNIAAVTGLKDTTTGDFITSSSNIATKAKNKLSEFVKEASSNCDFGHEAQVPKPVFFSSIEAPSQAYQSQLDVALFNLQREDPSFVVFQDDATSQTVVGGMGELHLEIIKNRIVSEYKVNVELGPLEIAYQELPKQLNMKNSHVLEHRIGTSLQNASITLSLLPKSSKDRNVLLLDKSPESAPNISSLQPRTISAIQQGVERALAHGPTLGYPIVDVSVMLHWFETNRSTTEATMGAAATQCVQKLLKSTGTYLREPVMNVEVVTDKDYSSPVLSDLTHRRATIEQVYPRGTQQIISALVPLAELLGYAADLRYLTSGTASFSMELECYHSLSESEEAKVIKKVTGFDP